MHVHLDLPVALANQICSHLSKGSLAAFTRSSLVVEKTHHPVICELTTDEQLEIFQWGARHGEESTIHYLLPNIVVASKTNPLVGVKALFSVCAAGMVHAVTGLLDGGVNPNAAIVGVSVLMEAASGRDYNRSDSVVRVLLDRGADIHAQDVRGRTALHFAAEGGNTIVINMLLQAGSDVHKQAEGDGSSPILLASLKGHYRTVQLLINSGARVNDRDRVERTALIHAADKSMASLVRLLIRNGAELDHTNIFGRAALSYASENGAIEVVTLLVQAGCDVHNRDYLGKTAFDYCDNPRFPWTAVRDILSAAAAENVDDMV